MSEKTYRPTGNWRHNHLSNKPGGWTIIVNYGGYDVEYNNIKYLSSYVEKIVEKDNSIQFIVLKDTGKILWDCNEIK